MTLQYSVDALPRDAGLCEDLILLMMAVAGKIFRQLCSLRTIWLACCATPDGQSRGFFALIFMATTARRYQKPIKGPGRQFVPGDRRR